MRLAEASRAVVLLLALSTGASCFASSASSTFQRFVKQAPNPEQMPVEDNSEVQQSPSEPGDNDGQTERDPICPREGTAAVCLDCSTISVCLRGKVLPARSCPKDVPYCVNSAMGSYCSAKPDDDREECQSDFQCTSAGYFPDPYNCHYFYLCDSDMKAIKYDCMPGYAYDMVQKNCRRQIFPQECKKLECSKSNGVWAYYDGSKQYYGYCYQTETGSEEVVLFKCSDGAEFDGHQCQFKCRAEGKFADTQDHTKYYECYYVGFQLHSRVKTCAKGMAFDANAKLCAPSRGISHY